MKRISTKIGDVFLVKTGNNTKKYFQYIANDLTQLNSDVIRGFKKNYSLDEDPGLEEVVKDDILFYAHCITKLGLKMGIWEKVGNILKNFYISEILFRDTNDYARKVDEEPVKISKNWYVWKINDNKFKKIGELHGAYKSASIGLVINPNGIVELLKGNKYPTNYPE